MKVYSFSLIVLVFLLNQESWGETLCARGEEIQTFSPPANLQPFFHPRSWPTDSPLPAPCCRFFKEKAPEWEDDQDGLDDLILEMVPPSGPLALQDRLAFSTHQLA